MNLLIETPTGCTILVGNNIKELILSRLIMQNENYIKRIKEMSSRIEPSIQPLLKSERNCGKEFIPEEISKYNTFYAGSGGIYGTVKGGKLLREAFPCIRNTIEGVSPADVMMLLYYY